MANTTNVSVSKSNGWSLIITASGSRKSGVISISGGGEYCESGSTPNDSLVGHVFTGQITPFDIEPGQRIYVKTYRLNDTVVVTED